MHYFLKKLFIDQNIEMKRLFVELSKTIEDLPVKVAIKRKSNNSQNKLNSLFQEKSTPKKIHSLSSQNSLRCLFREIGSKVGNQILI